MPVCHWTQSLLELGLLELVLFGCEFVIIIRKSEERWFSHSSFPATVEEGDGRAIQLVLSILLAPSTHLQSPFPRQGGGEPQDCWSMYILSCSLSLDMIGLGFLMAKASCGICFLGFIFGSNELALGTGVVRFFVGEAASCEPSSEGSKRILFPEQFR